MKRLLLLFSILLVGCGSTKRYENVNYVFDKEIGQYRVDIDNDGNWDYNTTKVIMVRQDDSRLKSYFYPENKVLVIYVRM